MKVQPIGEPHQGKQSYRFVCPGCAQYDEPGSTFIATHVFNSTWSYNGDGDSPTVSPSILVTGHDEKRCHSFIEEGRIRFLSDCSHSLAGKTVQLLEIDP